MVAGSVPNAFATSSASTLVVASENYKRGVDAIVTKVQANDHASAPVNADTVTALGPTKLQQKWVTVFNLGGQFKFTHRQF